MAWCGGCHPLSRLRHCNEHQIPVVLKVCDEVYRNARSKALSLKSLPNDEHRSQKFNNNLPSTRNQQSKFGRFAAREPRPKKRLQVHRSEIKAVIRLIWARPEDVDHPRNVWQSILTWNMEQPKFERDETSENDIAGPKFANLPQEIESR
ncbi:hypothetical protein NPIL_698921 [Nephila pilipes]|uniref:Uncharacterized protein n=1 Tax=Nephila pilipes TaxID=299642 RepID=A0A8X6N4U5_NEPPI|nr:hypothetical protein NPIL_698921 [Nephila pilipes]